MILEYAKHYPNESDITYFDITRYLYGKDQMQQQKCFANIEAWVEHRGHQRVTHDLYVYRTKARRWHISVDGSAPDLELWDGIFFHNDTVNS